MAINVGYLTAGRDSASDECLTPRYAVTPIIKYLKDKGYENILCPFDKANSFYVRELSSNGFKVAYSHKDEVDFFDIQDIDDFDCIVSNPPFSVKDKVLEHLYSLEIPFAMLMPQNALQGIARVNLYKKYGVEYMGFDRRVNFYTNGDLSGWRKGNHFASGYFCRGVLPEKLMFEELIEVQEPYEA